MALADAKTSGWSEIWQGKTLCWQWLVSSSMQWKTLVQDGVPRKPDGGTVAQRFPTHIVA